MYKRIVNPIRIELSISLKEDSARSTLQRKAGKIPQRASTARKIQ